MAKYRRKKWTERYDLHSSPLAQRPTQREVGLLLGETRDDLRRLVNFKEQFVVRRQEEIGKKKKLRELIYPRGRLRVVHEKLKYHLNKVRQPSYLFSPRKGRSQRQNAAHHLDQSQYLTLDLKQFYPSTTEHMVYSWFHDELGLYEDVAGLLTRLCTIDGKVSFGSPLTPVLVTLVHRDMFDGIAEICRLRGLRYSVWVDDLTISGRFVPGDVLEKIREIVRTTKLKTHRIRYRSGNRPVNITGIGVVGRRLIAPRALHLKLQDLWRNYHESQTDDERDACCQLLLTNLGVLRSIAGRDTIEGRKAADRMNSLRQKQSRRQLIAREEVKNRHQSQFHEGRSDGASIADAPI